jgi:hypothetical protein
MFDRKTVGDACHLVVVSSLVLVNTPGAAEAASVEDLEAGPTTADDVALDEGRPPGDGGRIDDPGFDADEHFVQQEI